MTFSGIYNFMMQRRPASKNKLVWFPMNFNMSADLPVESMGPRGHHQASHLHAWRVLLLINTNSLWTRKKTFHVTGIYVYYSPRYQARDVFNQAKHGKRPGQDNLLVMGRTTMGIVCSSRS